MAIDLTKGGKINLSKDNPSLKRVRIGLGWEANEEENGYEFDLDASLFICTTDMISQKPKLIGEPYFVFYGNKYSPDGSAQHSGDNRNGAGAAGDKETILVNLEKADPRAVDYSFIVTIHDCKARRQHFGMVRNAYIKLYDDETGKVIVNYSLSDEYNGKSSVQVGSIYKENGEWLFGAIGEGSDRELGDYVEAYGAEVKR